MLSPEGSAEGSTTLQNTSSEQAKVNTNVGAENAVKTDSKEHRNKTDLFIK